MPETVTVLGIAHYNFRLERALMEKVRDFYVQIVGMTVGPRPAVGIHGFWLYAGDQDVLHLAEEDSRDKRRSGSEMTFDHVALNCTDWPSQRRRLVAHAVPFVEQTDPEIGRLQVFFRDPAGNGVELIFAQGEA
jgi:catechol-2,3-dioxygenase